MVRFQSAPRTFMRGDRDGAQHPARPARFNPRPALSCGATKILRGCVILSGVSIRAPHFHAGRHAYCWADVIAAQFQSAPRTFMRGDLQGGQTTSGDILFQSAPRTFMRGDHGSMGSPFVAQGFQSAPRTFMRGDFRTRPALSYILPVSIRAPHFHAGRPRLCKKCNQEFTFQSAPRTFMRGDLQWLMSTLCPNCFNPRPALSCGATAAAVNDTAARS